PRGGPPQRHGRLIRAAPTLAGSASSEGRPGGAPPSEGPLFCLAAPHTVTPLACIWPRNWKRGGRVQQGRRGHPTLAVSPAGALRVSPAGAPSDSGLRLQEGQPTNN